MVKTGDQKKQVIDALKKLGGKAFTKKIGETAKMSQQTASKYLLVLESEKNVERDESQPPYVYWSIIDRMKK